MRFTADARPGIEAGTTTRTYRVWAAPQAKVGGRYRTGDLTVLVDAVTLVTAKSITNCDARAAGFADRDALLDFLERLPHQRARGAVVATDRLYRIDFHVVAPDDGPPLSAQAELAANELAVLREKLDAMDRRAAAPWAWRTLALIGERPGTVSTELAAVVGQERPDFKLNVRKLKALGLTISLDVGYELSPRGRALLAASG